MRHLFGEIVEWGFIILIAACVLAGALQVARAIIQHKF